MEHKIEVYKLATCIIFNSHVDPSIIIMTVACKLQLSFNKQSGFHLGGQGKLPSQSAELPPKLVLAKALEWPFLLGSLCLKTA